MIFLDSWVWLEFFFGDDKYPAARSAIERANTAEETGVLAATAVTEVSYRLRREKDNATATKAIEGIRALEHVQIAPVTADIAERAAHYRDQYYERGSCELSYADAIHLATAIALPDCDVLFSGDPDFADVDEIDVVVL